MHKQRVDDQKGGDGEGEDAHRRRRPARRPREHRHRHHRHRPEDGWLPAGEKAEEDEYGGAGEQAPADGHPPEHRSDESEDECQVLAGDDEQVREPGAAEVVDDLRGLASIVTEHEAEEQGAV